MSQNPFLSQAPIEGIKQIIVVGSGKGGVGKSTTSVNLACALKQKGLKVGLLDADIYGPSLPRMMGAINQHPQVDEEKKIIPLVRLGIKLMSLGFLVEEGSSVVWRGPMIFKALDQFLRDVKWGELDYLIIDLPPGTGDVPLTIAQKVPVSGAIIVTTPQNISLVDAKKAMDMFNQINVPLLGVVENMSSFTPPGAAEPLQLFPKGDLDKFLVDQKILKMIEIPFNPAVGLCSEAGIPIVESNPEGLEAKAFTGLAEKVCSHF